MLKKLHIQNLTVFPDSDLIFGTKLNVIVGENGAGKTHLLKVLYSVLATSWEDGRRQTNGEPIKSAFQSRLADKLVQVFRPESLGRLVRRRQGRGRCDVSVGFEDKALNIEFGFATNSKSEVSIAKLPKKWAKTAPVYLPTRELLTLYPGFVALYEGRYLEFEETWKDTCLLLGAPLQKGPREKQTKKLLEPLERAMGGSIILDQNGRFYLKNQSGLMEMPLVAEGHRKLAMLARLIASGSLQSKGYLLWDEPEANMNPKLIRELANTIVHLCEEGIQVFVATHSLFLLREIEILLTQRAGSYDAGSIRFFGLHPSDEGVKIEQGESLDDIGKLTVLEEELHQSDRFMGL